MAGWTASAKWAKGPALDGQCGTPLALSLTEGLGSAAAPLPAPYLAPQAVELGRCLSDAIAASVADEWAKRVDDRQRYLPGAGSDARRRPTNTLLKLREAH